MKILSRYIFSECLVFFILSLFAFTGVLFTIQLLRFSDLIINRGVEMQQIGLVFLSLIPTFMEFALPMSALLGIMLGLSRLSGDSEIIVLRSSGVSIYQLLWPICILALVLGVVASAVSMRLKPWGFRTLSATLFDIAKSRSTAGLDQGVFNKLGNVTLYAESIEYSTGKLKNVMVDDRRANESRKIIFAKTGSIASDEQNRTIFIFLHDGMMHEQVEGKYGLTRFVDNQVGISPDDLYGDQADKDMPPRSMYLGEISAQTDHMINVRNSLATIPNLEKDTPIGKISPELLPEDLKSPELSTFTEKIVRKKITRLKLENGLRFSMPFAAIILAFAAMPLGIQSPRTQRTWGPTISFLLGIGIFAVYYALLSVGMTLSDSGAINPYVTCWLPNIVIGIIAVTSVMAVASERIQSVPQALESFFVRLLPKRKST